MLYTRDDDFDVDDWRDSLDGAKSAAGKLTVDMVLALLPETGSKPKNAVIETLRDKGSGERKARAFLNQHTSASGPIYEWRIKRSSKRDELHLARCPQRDWERQRRRYWQAADNNANNGFRQLQAATSLGELPTTTNETSDSGAVIRVYDEAGNVIETHEHKGDFKEW